MGNIWSRSSKKDPIKYSCDPTPMLQRGSRATDQMEVLTTKIDGVLIIEPKVFGDKRGFFQETYHKARYRELAGLDVEFVQDNHSRSTLDVLRGLHIQRRFPQGKLVRVSRGRVWDVAVDLRMSSSTLGHWVATELSDNNHRQFYIPPGVAHGFCVLSEVADFEYKCTEVYHPEDEVGIHYADSQLAIDWPIDDPVVSEKDSKNISFASYLSLANTDPL